MVSGEGVGKEDWVAVEPWFALWLFTVTGKRKIHKLLQNGAFRIVFFFDRAQRCFQRFKGYRSLVHLGRTRKKPMWWVRLPQERTFLIELVFSFY